MDPAERLDPVLPRGDESDGEEGGNGCVPPPPAAPPPFLPVLLPPPTDGPAEEGVRVMNEAEWGVRDEMLDESRRLASWIDDAAPPLIVEALAESSCVGVVSSFQERI